MSVLAIGTLIQKGDGANPENFTTISEVRSITGPTLKTDVKDVTSHSSPGRTRQRRGVLKDPGDMKFKISFDPTDPTHNYTSGLLGDWDNFVVGHYRLVIPTAPSTKWLLTAFVSDISEMFPIDDVMTSDVTLTNAQIPQFTGVV